MGSFCRDSIKRKRQKGTASQGRWGGGKEVRSRVKKGLKRPRNNTSTHHKTAVKERRPDVIIRMFNGERKGLRNSLGICKEATEGRG